MMSMKSSTITLKIPVHTRYTTIITLMISVSFDHPFSLNENRRFLGLPQGTKRQRSVNYSPDNLTYFIMQENTLVMKRTLENDAKTALGFAQIKTEITGELG